MLNCNTHVGGMACVNQVGVGGQQEACDCSEEDPKTEVMECLRTGFNANVPAKKKKKAVYTAISCIHKDIVRSQWLN